MFALMESAPDDELVSAIARYVMKYLERSRLIEKLDDLLSPETDSSSTQVCDGTYRLSESILLASGLSQDDLADIFAVLQSKGACCDCEVLYNVAEVSRLKAKYWRGRAAEQLARIGHSPNSRPN